MKNKKELFEFLSQLIDIQIKKYVALTTEGIIHDPRFNAKLVFAEISELLGFAEQLIADMEDPLEGKLNNPKHFSELFNQVKFYLEQEYARAYAGWILDEKNSPEEVEQRLTRLKKIGESAGVDCTSASIAVTQIQKQCEYDSALIAFQVFDLVKNIKENPDMELDSTIPKEAQIRLKHNAKTRYCEKECAASIDGIHQSYKEFLEQSDVEHKSSSVLAKEETEIYEEHHRNQWKSLLERYQIIKAIPDSSKTPILESEEDKSPVHSPSEECLISLHNDEEKKSKNTTSPTAKKTESSGLIRNSIFYGGLAFVGAVAVCMLMAYFTKGSKSDLNPLFKPS
ncbi:hypothetical protein Lgra_2885 [Legionella gratiana]|uniref:Uncharacterized protein n=1 Tax=Legionella gratiana TaxID=45066 RepID=A0A378J543_9GAMM|nr:hypothetical protein [Legionella gratiana]KTD06108.1 hypothetical protein Lgra_2885 [Legionella gratiana]STX42862.1 Uncharacterised protein [Legionella gratiana]